VNAAHLHLILNHLPIVSVPMVAIVVAWGLVRRSRDIVRLGLGLAIAVAVVTYPIFLTGESAEEIVEDTAWGAEALIEEHEERATVALIAVLVTGALSAVALWQLRGDRPLKLAVPSVVVVALLVSSGVLGLTALDGGKIRHDEIRADQGATAETRSEQRETDDDGERERSP